MKVTDYFTKWAEAYPLKDSEVPTCMRSLYNNFFSRFGLPRQLHTDQGKNFESKLFYEFCRLTGVRKTRTTPFHPQSDGQTERMNRTLLQMLRATCQENPHDWPQKLDTVMSAYRMTVHKVTGVTPNLAMLGREVMLPASVIARPPEEPVSTAVPFNQSLRDCLRAAHSQVRKSTKSVAKTQKSYFDRSVKHFDFTVGQLVWLFWPSPPRRQKFRKLQWQWTGPWRIESFRSDVVVSLVHTTKQWRQVVHVNRLSPCKGTPQNSSFDLPPEEPLAASTEVSAETEHQSSAVLAPPSLTPHPASVERPRRKRRLPMALEPYVVEM